ncbi:MAG: UDP-N-acetylmuramoylalanyl-D-glutamyl-2,6-diaminopimelate--D-alanyl-D-alanine ligase [Parvibaculaceae bacterium]|nr:UDP-N-acetylmuramoylalanyl-D-glutamyl-2,6-diaminopimelate--D-alanyl-D-alanine ligase [Parvibaculaceae bacterium]
MSDALWTSQDAEAATGGRSTRAWEARGVSIDTRTIEAGDLFVAIDGENSDGHDYVQKAFAAGAGAALVSYTNDEMEAAGPLLVVDDTLMSLEAMARAARARMVGKIVAVTGSVGKTGTKEALREIFSHQGKVHASAASYNNHWGVPLTLARMPADTEFGVIEIGMNHPGEIIPLVAMTQPHVALITTVAPVHMEFFDSVEDIADAKAEIFTGLVPGGVAIVNGDIAQFEYLKKKAQEARVARLVSFGHSSDADVHLKKVVLKAECSCVSVEAYGEMVTYKLGVPGEHVVMNSLGMIAVVQEMGGDLAKALMCLASLTAPKGRGARGDVTLENGSFLLIDESYNANPASMTAAMAAVGQIAPENHGRRIAVLGDMLELGVQSSRLHAGLTKPLMAAGIDLLFACGPQMKNLFDAVPKARRGVYAETSQDLKKSLLHSVRANDVVVVKGSLGSRMGLLVDALQELGHASGVKNAASEGEE